MDIELLKTFLEVRSTRHFGRAAENLYLTQAAVSARIRQLEELLGVRLFSRNRNNIQLTSEGERLIPHAETVLLAWSKARQDVALDTGQTSQIHIGISAGLWNTALQECLWTLHSAMPDVAIRTQGHVADSAGSMLLDRTLDIAISYDHPSLPEFKRREIGEFNLYLYSRGKNVGLDGALAQGYVFVDWGSAFARFHAKRFGETSTPVLRTNIAESARDFVCKSGGAAYLPTMMSKGHGRALHRVEDAPAYSRKLHASYRASSDRIPLIEAVLECFQGLKI